MIPGHPHSMVTVVALSVVLLFMNLVLQDATMTRERGLKWNMGARDGTPAELSIVASRAHRAFENFKETYPAFIVLAVLVLATGSTSQAASIGAWTWLGARIIYIPLYLSGVHTFRSLVWIVSIVALLPMLLTVL